MGEIYGNLNKDDLMQQINLTNELQMTLQYLFIQSHSSIDLNLT